MVVVQRTLEVPQAGRRIMNDFETNLNVLLVDTFNNILKLEESYIKRFAENPITVSEAHLLEAIGKQGGNASVGAIAAELGVTMPTATVAIKRLAAKGFVTKEACADDGRKAIISLTDLGKKVNRTHELFHEIMVRNISREFEPHEREELLRAVKKLSDFFQRKTR
jgi:DNA-binding MarR family transcriptional regulator